MKMPWLQQSLPPVKRRGRALDILVRMEFETSWNPAHADIAMSSMKLRQRRDKKTAQIFCFLVLPSSCSAFALPDDAGIQNSVSIDG